MDVSLQMSKTFLRYDVHDCTGDGNWRCRIKVHDYSTLAAGGDAYCMID